MLNRWRSYRTPIGALTMASAERRSGPGDGSRRGGGNGSFPGAGRYWRSAMNKQVLRRYLLPGVVVVVFLLGPGASHAEAYIDPGTGSHLLSTLGIMIGVVSTCYFFGIGQVRRCGEWFWAKLGERRKA